MEAEFVLRKFQKQSGGLFPGRRSKPQELVYSPFLSMTLIRSPTRQL